MAPLCYDLVECPDLPGNFYVPNRQSVKGAVLLLHGSEGGGFGFHNVDAQILAAHGFAALAFTWCGSPAAPVDRVPSAVINIDLERTIQALQWLRSRIESDNRLAICGVSRGAEQALILAALSAKHLEIPKLDAVATLAPTDVYVQGFSWNWVSVGGSEPDDPFAKTWLWHGQPVGTVGKPIPIDSFDGHALLCHGVDDEIWSVERTKRLEKRLLEAKRSVDCLYLKGEKHKLSENGLHSYRSKLVDFLERAIAD
jgi:pimeloyl-ACP methyl ester carboxylesterase